MGAGGDEALAGEIGFGTLRSGLTPGILSFLSLFKS